MSLSVQTFETCVGSELRSLTAGAIEFRMKTTSAFLLLFAFVALGGIAVTLAVKDRPTRVVPLTLKNFDTETQSGTWIVELCVSIRSFRLFLTVSTALHHGAHTAKNTPKRTMRRRWL